MGLFFPEDPHFDETKRQTGFYRYRQLLSARFGQWWRINLLTLAGFAPLAAGIFYAAASTSVLVLLPASLLGGMIAGPFLAGMYDAILRGLRDDPLPWREGYRRSWKQNWRGSLVPGALLGLVSGVYAFMAMLFWWAERAPSPGTVAVYLFALLVVLIVNTLYWPQLVLFQQKASVRLQNACCSASGISGVSWAWGSCSWAVWRCLCCSRPGRCSCCLFSACGTFCSSLSFCSMSRWMTLTESRSTTARGGRCSPLLPAAAISRAVSLLSGNFH